ncbi:GTP cyclohydrolase II RibA [Nocardioides sp. cx-169]|uniref:GTP cyclohydrolase II RibA n=1 Tax=Nocardioides sp. cx-169 TaxID=2899080 RepID=UPI001E5E4EC0|nr:GTP cyclohydrolase II RibA [Nocardioides sp. cx-169]MCD4534250.1 GTP cyclohydrolase II RibA [Nocardioides sp. cx-169]
MTTPSVGVRTRVPFRLQPRPWLCVEAEMVSFNNLPSGAEHVAILHGSPQPGCLVRVHSECLTGDVFGSTRCDCGDQLRESLELIAKEGGVILYMRQEGRGIGLYKKLEAYVIQDAGADTFAANEALGRRADERDYGECATMLRALGLEEIELMTNNPSKIESLRQSGLTIAAVRSTGLHITPENADYLQQKASIGGHSLALGKETV